MLRWI